MFNSKSKSREEVNAPSGSTTIIGSGTTINGDVESSGDIRIDGVVKGNLYGKAKIIIGPEGLIEGDIDGRQADILGKVIGKIKIVDHLHIHGNAVVTGDLYAGKLQIEPTASFNGQCHMGANVVELNTELNNAINN